ncbi:MAG: hypothetical protein CVU08_01875 [Bacteroidetes bacterium HGW-Bacteroidetes-3]|jgi:hypothetical protein|nr:MAG: hypothetical protein CVU08_01875 [Bacteroidetes bacterium HGW-Bacteroidetes-3]
MVLVPFFCNKNWLQKLKVFRIFWFNPNKDSNLYIVVLGLPGISVGVTLRVGLFVTIFFKLKKLQKRIFTSIPNAD